MKREKVTYTTIDEYILEFPEDIQVKLKDIRNIIKELIPKEATEKISWDMPTFYLNGNLVHFAGHKSHIGFYPGAEGIEHFIDQFDEKKLKYSKGAVQFPNSKPLPKKLIQDIVKFRIKQNT